MRPRRQRNRRGRVSSIGRQRELHTGSICCCCFRNAMNTDTPAKKHKTPKERKSRWEFDEEDAWEQSGGDGGLKRSRGWTLGASLTGQQPQARSAVFSSLSGRLVAGGPVRRDAGGGGAPSAPGARPLTGCRGCQPACEWLRRGPRVFPGLADRKMEQTGASWLALLHCPCTGPCITPQNSSD